MYTHTHTEYGAFSGAAAWRASHVNNTGPGGLNDQDPQYYQPPVIHAGNQKRLRPMHSTADLT